MNKMEEELLAAVRAINTSMLASDGHTTISIKLENGNILAVVGKYCLFFTSPSPREPKRWGMACSG
jgi:hypothetical protein